MPALTLSTDKAAHSRSTSPTRPPMSPITPPLAPTRPPDDPQAAGTLPPSRRPLTHSSQPSQQIGIPPPPPEPIDFDSNPDVIALKSAISVLQVQKNRATGDIQALNKVREEAMQEPEAFIRDLAAGNVKHREAYMFGADTSDDDDNDAEDNDSKSSSKGLRENPKAWSSLPKPQDVVRCPPINWAQYAVVGESLNKLHAEQVNHPSQGTPAVFGSNGLYDTKGEGRQEPYSGVAAPYDPRRDVIDRKTKSRK